MRLEESCAHLFVLFSSCKAHHEQPLHWVASTGLVFTKPRFAWASFTRTNVEVSVQRSLCVSFFCGRPMDSVHLQRTSKSISLVLEQPLTPWGACINTLSFDKACRLQATLFLSLLMPSPCKKLLFLEGYKGYNCCWFEMRCDGKGICHQGEFC